MTVIAEIRDAVAMIADVVDQTRTLLAALNDGREYLQKNHPGASEDLGALVKEMSTTVAGLHSASRIIIDFDFTVDGNDRDREPARFNEHLIQFGSRVASLENDIASLKGSCSRVKELSKSLDARAGDRPWWALLGDRAGLRAGELSTTLLRLYGMDWDMAENALSVLRATDAALGEVRSALHADRTASGSSTANIDAAAHVLHEQAQELRPQVVRLADLRRDLEVQIAALN
jgi:hypothetical protein